MPEAETGFDRAKQTSLFNELNHGNLKQMSGRDLTLPHPCFQSAIVTALQKL